MYSTWFALCATCFSCSACPWIQQSLQSWSYNRNVMIHYWKGGGQKLVSYAFNSKRFFHPATECFFATRTRQSFIGNRLLYVSVCHSIPFESFYRNRARILSRESLGWAEGRGRWAETALLRGVWLWPFWEERASERVSFIVLLLFFFRLMICSTPKPTPTPLRGGIVARRQEGDFSGLEMPLRPSKAPFPPYPGVRLLRIFGKYVAPHLQPHVCPTRVRATVFVF